MKRMGIVMSFEFRRTALALMALALSSVSAAALPANVGRGLSQMPALGAHLGDGAITVPPNAFANFCDAYSDQCNGTGAAEPIALDGDRWADLQEVNRRVNAHITPQNDAPGADTWSLGVDRGDCDDYAVEKRKELLDRGWPSAALLLAVAYLPDGTPHLVLTARTDRGDLVLDNLKARIVSADKTGYRWVAHQSTVHPRLWTIVGRIARDPVVVAAARPLGTPEPVLAAAPAAEPATPVAVTIETPVLDTPVAAAPAGVDTDPTVVGTVPGFETWRLRLAAVEG